MTDLSPYKIFEAVAATGSMAKAADILNLTPSAVSHAISRLEQDFGFPLFVREKKGCYLTPYGDNLLPNIRQILQLQSKLDFEVGLMRNVVKGNVNLGIFNSVVYHLLGPELSRLSEQYPDLRINLYQGGYSDCLDLLLRHKLDISFVHPPIPETVHYIPLIKDPLVCITPRDYRIKGSVVSADELKDMHLIQSDDGYIYDLKGFFAKNSLNVSSRHSMIDDSAIIALVGYGYGCSILPKMIVDGLPGDVNIYPIENNPTRTIGIATHPTKFITPATKLLYRIICEKVREVYPDNCLI